MKDLKNITALFILFLAGCFLHFASAHALAADKTLTVGTGSGTWGDTVSVPIIIDNPAGVGGVAFTLTYDRGVFDFQGLETATKTISDGSEYYDSNNDTYKVTDAQRETVSNTLFYQTNEDAQNGKVMVAAASAKELSDTTLFKAKFLIKDGSDQGTYPIGLVRTIIENPSAGYPEATFLPVVVGMPASQPNTEGFYPTPTYSATLVAGSITVNPSADALHSISGSVTYEGGSPAADGSPVILKKLVDGEYVYDADTTVINGSYNFSNKLNGQYRVVARSLDPRYFDATADVTVSDADVTADIVLPAPVYVSGTLSINGGYVKGLKVKVMSEGGGVVGIFPVNPDGTFQSGPLPPGTYTVKGVYGTLESDTFDPSNPYDWTVALYSISGTVSGLNQNDVATITVNSVSGGLSKTVSSDPADSNGKASYTVDNLVPADDYIVSAVGPGLPVLYFDGTTDITEATQVDISSGNRTANFDYTTITKGSISGTVTEGGGPKAGIGVFAFDVNTFALTSVLTNSSGEYTLTLAPGTYEVFVIKANGKVFYYSDSGTTQNEANATLIQVAAGDAITGKDMDVTECDKTLTGKVTYERADGDPVPNALITATSADSRAVAVTGDDGTYILTGLCNGTVYNVKMTPLEGNFAVQTATITAGTDTTLNFIIDTGNVLSGTVKDSSSGEGISGAMIYLIDQETRQLVGGQMYFSGAGGAYRIGDIPTGVYTIVVSHPLYRTYTEENVAIDKDTSKDISLVQGAHFSGTVVDGDNGNAPLQGVLVIVTRTGGVPVYDITDQNGQYAIYGLDETKADYIIMAQKRGYQRKVLTNQQPTAQVDITLTHPAALFDLSGTITKDDECGGGGVADAIVVVSSASKNFLAVDTTDSIGAYSFKDLPQSDDYRFVVIPGGGLQAYVETGLSFTGDATKNITLPCGSKISGTVTWTGTGKAYVFLYTDGNDFVDYTTVDASGGTYTFSGLDSGNYKVLAVASGNTPKWYNGKSSIDTADLVSAGATGVDIDLTQ